MLVAIAREDVSLDNPHTLVDVVDVYHPEISHSMFSLSWNKVKQGRTIYETIQYLRSIGWTIEGVSYQYISGKSKY
jgi:hypothetical protein